ncbi:hypothetical protein [Nonomuraea sp. SBT364]|uniref:hypothetical protein n=1 Tax=Nonomuraea sp. SBT364 TaxID=1580530 RepID=UPI0012E25374|nr:hypothetical protein [Nonomuraea sp. SBT364]
MAAPRMIPCVLVLATLTLGACTSAPSLSGGAPRLSGTAGGPGGAGTPSPSLATLTADAYKGELDTRHDALSDAIKSVAAARGLKSLRQRVGMAEEEMLGAADELAALAPPAEVRAQHDAYVASMRGLATELGGATGKVGSGGLCTSSAVLTDVRGALGDLDKAGETLQEAGGYPADVVSVKAGGKKTRRLGNGHYLRKGGLGGRSSLQIHNGGSRDAVVNVMRGKSKVISVYVRKKAKFKIPGMRDGTYKIYFTSGVDWDGKSRAFTRDCSFKRFQKSVKFKTTYTSTQILWHDWRITLHAITGGNARTSEVDPDDFPG